MADRATSINSTTYDDRFYKSLQVRAKLEIPVYASPATFPKDSMQPGSIVYSLSDAAIYVSDGEVWEVVSAPYAATYVTATPNGILPNERVLTAGSGITIVDGGANGPITVSRPGGGAPTTAQYVTLGTDAGLTAERVLTAGAGISFVDSGPDGTLTISASSGAPVDATYVVASTDPTLTQERALAVSGAGISLVAGVGTLTLNVTTVNAPLTAQYLLVSANGTLTQSRRVVAGTNISVTDGGAGSTLTIAHTGTSAPADATYVLVSADATLTGSSVLTAGTNITLTDGGPNSTITVAVNQPMNTTGDTLYYNSGLQRLAIGTNYYQSKASTSSLPIWEYRLTPDGQGFWYDDFMNNASPFNDLNSGINTANSASVAAFTPVAGGAQFGAVVMSTNASATASAVYGGRQTSSMWFGSGLYIVTEWGALTPSALSSVTDTFVFRMGYANSTSNAITVGAFFTHDRSLSTTNWVCRCQTSGSNITNSVTSTAVSLNTWQRFRIVIDATPTATFYINDALVATISTFVPTSITSTTGTPMIELRKTLGTGNITAGIDYVWTLARTSTRY